MTTDVSTINTSNFSAMAQAMGMGADMAKQTTKSSTLPRLRIWNKPVMGQVEVKGKMKNMEVVPSGSYRLQLPDETYVYAESIKIRVFLQRFLYKRYDSTENVYVKTIMGEDLNGDMKDTSGTYNCGKPAGWLADWKDLSEDKQNFYQSIKRNRVLLGEVKLINAVDGIGEALPEEQSYPFIWEIQGRDAFKTMGEPFTKLGKNRRLPVQHWITCATKRGGDEKTAIEYYVPTYSLDLSSSITITDEDQQKFQDYIEWIGNYNEYVVNSHNDSLGKQISEEDVALVDEFIDIDENQG